MKVSHWERHTVEVSIHITCMKVQEVITINSTLDSGCFTDVLNLPLLWRNQDWSCSRQTLGVLGWSFEGIRRFQTACLCGFHWSEVGIIYLDYMESHALTTDYLTICPLWRWPESTRVNLLSTIASRMAVVYSKRVTVPTFLGEHWYLKYSDREMSRDMFATFGTWWPLSAILYK